MFFKNLFFYIAGTAFLILAKSKNILQGYASPKPFNISNTDQCIDYDINVVEHWLSHLKTYTSSEITIKDKTVLELGPGSDLGIGITLLSKGCSQYHACDVNNLIKSTPDSFYQQLFQRLESTNNKADIDHLKAQLKTFNEGKPSSLNHVVKDDFDLVSAFGENTVDIVFSQAAFEHFDDIEATISKLSTVCKPGAVIVAEIDLTTHSRWVRDVDPNNIYRFCNFIYNLFWFRGIPNRVRPYQYKNAFENNGWSDIKLTPLRQLESHTVASKGMSKIFTDDSNQMDYLTFIFCATKK